MVRKSSRRASVHANRSWQCPGCTRTVFGNGGKSSHQRACRAYKEYRFERVSITLTQIDAGEWGKRMTPATRANFREQYDAEFGEAQRGVVGR